jgi:hypothetical protein
MSTSALARAALLAVTASLLAAGSGQTAPLPTNIAAMKSLAAQNTTQVRWGGWGYRGGGWGYRGRGWGYRGWGWGAAATGAIVGGAIASGAYYGGYPYYDYGAYPYYGGSYAYGGCSPYGGYYGTPYRRYYGW